MKKNRRNVHGSSSSLPATMNNNNVINDAPDSPCSNASSNRGRGQSLKSKQHHQQSSKNIYEKFDDDIGSINTNNNSASSDCGTPVSSPIVKDPYEFRKEDNDDSEHVTTIKTTSDNHGIDQKSPTIDQPDHVKHVNETINSNNNVNSSTPKVKKDKRMSHGNHKKSIGINTTNQQDNYIDDKTCPPGTVVQLSGIVWLETTAGMLIINVTWRGRSYIGSLLDTSQHKFSPPISQINQTNPHQQYNSPTTKGGFKTKKRHSFNIPHKLPVGRPTSNNKRTKSHVKNPSAKTLRGTPNQHQQRLISESSSSIDGDGSSVDENVKEEMRPIECPISGCPEKFGNFNLLRQHLAEHSPVVAKQSPDESLSKVLTNSDNDTENTLINVDAETSCRPNPPRPASVMPITTAGEKRPIETRTPSPPRLAMAQSPQPQTQTQQQQALKHSYNNGKKLKTNLDHEQAQMLMMKSLFSSIKPPPTSAGHLLTSLNNNNTNNFNNMFHGQNPPKLLPEVNINTQQHQQQQAMNNNGSQRKTMPLPNPLGPVNKALNPVVQLNNNINNNNSGHSIKNFISDSLLAVAAASGKFHHQPQPLSSSSSLPAASNSSSDLFAAAMAKMLGVAGGGPQSTAPSTPMNNNQQQFDTKSLSSADYLMKLPGLLSSSSSSSTSSSNQMR